MLRLGIPDLGDPRFTYYYLQRCRRADGSLWIRTSVYYADHGHASGGKLVRPEDPDYELWLWVFRRLRSKHRSKITSTEVAALRPEFERERDLANDVAAFHSGLLSAVPVCGPPTVTERVQTITGRLACCVLLAPYLVAVATVGAVRRTARRQRNKRGAPHYPTPVVGIPTPGAKRCP